MAFFGFLHDSSGIRDVYAHNRHRYRPIREFRQDILRGPSPLSVGERELLAAFVSMLNQCRFCTASHTATVAELGVDVSVLDGLVRNIDDAAISDRLRPIFRFVKKLTEQPSTVGQADADAVFAAGWDENALEDAIAICAYYNMVNRLADGHGLKVLRNNPAVEQQE